MAWVCAPMLTAFLRALDSCAPGSSSGLGAPVIESHFESSHSESSTQNSLVLTLTWYGMVWLCRSPPLLPAAGPLPGLDARKKRLRRLELGGAPVALRFPLSAGRSEMIGCKRRSYAKADSHPPPRRRGSCWLRDRWPVGWPCLVDPPRSDRRARPVTGVVD